MKTLLALILCGLAATATAQNPPVAPPAVPPPAPAPVAPVAPAPQSARQFAAGIIAAGNATPTVSASFEPAVTRVGRPVDYCLTATGAQVIQNMPEPLPAPEALTLQGGRQSFNVQVRNNVPVQVSTVHITVVAGVAGEFTMPGYEVTVGGQRMQVPPAKLIVTEAQPGEPVAQKVRAVLEVPDRTIYVGESLIVRLLVLDTPDETPQAVSHVNKTSGGVIFRSSNRTARDTFTWEGKPASGLIMPVHITPMFEGETDLNCEVVVQVQKLEEGGRRGNFVYQATLSTPSIHLKTESVPKLGRPAGYTGGIGQFTISQPKVSATEIVAGEPLTVSFTLRGEGNIEGIAVPEVPDNRHWDVYPPTTELAKDEISLSGAKTFTYTMLPKHGGLLSTPPMPFSAFDPAKHVFVDMTIPPISVVVKANPNEAAVTASTPTSTPPAEPTIESAQPALTGLEEKSGRWVHTLQPALWQPWFLTVQAVPAILLIGLWLWRRRQDYIAANPQIIRCRRARAAARRELKLARQAAQRGDSEAFLRAGISALREAAAPLDSALPTSLVAEEVFRQLRHDPKACSAAKLVFQSAEAKHYAGSEESREPVATLLPGLEAAVAKLNARL